MYNQLRWKEINVKARMKRKVCKDSFTVINQSTEVLTEVDLLIIIYFNIKDIFLCMASSFLYQHVFDLRTFL